MGYYAYIIRALSYGELGSVSGFDSIQDEFRLLKNFTGVFYPVYWPIRLIVPVLLLAMD